MECGAGGTGAAAKRQGSDDVQGAETILVVEDDAQVRRVVCLTLELQGYRVLAAENAAQALRLLAAERDAVEMLLTDVIMPGMSGPRLYEELCSTRGEMRVLFISGYSDDVLASHGLASADPRFLAKPFTPSTLGGKLRQQLRSAARSAGPRRRA